MTMPCGRRFDTGLCAALRTWVRYDGGTDSRAPMPITDQEARPGSLPEEEDDNVRQALQGLAGRGAEAADAAQDQRLYQPRDLRSAVSRQDCDHLLRDGNHLRRVQA